MRSKYVQVHDGVPNEYDREVLTLTRTKDGAIMERKGWRIKTCCCDCNLVHEYYFFLSGDRKTLTRIPFRDKRATAQRRRKL